MKDLRNESVGMLVAEKPYRATVFDQFGIDYCCGGKQTLETACRQLGIDTADVIAHLLDRDDCAVPGADDECWLEASLASLVDHIEKTHHAYLKTELPRLEALAEKVLSVHGEKDSRLAQVVAVFAAFRQEMEPHTMKEETILFPYIRCLEHSQSLPRMPFGTVANPVGCMEAEHEDAARALMQLQELTDHYQAPQHACASWKALLDGLARLDKDLKVHVHKENTILFPRAIAAEALIKGQAVC
jgi:regulator of cell morphogenesis and NO signaling